MEQSNFATYSLPQDVQQNIEFTEESRKLVKSIRKSTAAVIETWTDSTLTAKEKLATPYKTLSAKAGQGVVYEYVYHESIISNVLQFRETMNAIAAAQGDLAKLERRNCDQVICSFCGLTKKNKIFHFRFARLLSSMFATTTYIRRLVPS